MAKPNHKIFHVMKDGAFLQQQDVQLYKSPSPNQGRVRRWFVRFSTDYFAQSTNFNMEKCILEIS